MDVHHLFKMKLTKQQIETKAKEITDYLYDAYGSGYGVLFGIPSHCREAVYKIIELTISKSIQRLADKSKTKMF